MKNQNLAHCEECSSQFFSAKSEMMSLCPECAHYLYGYENCEHKFDYGRCTRCYWDGSSSAYVAKLKSGSS